MQLPRGISLVLDEVHTGWKKNHDFVGVEWTSGSFSKMICSLSSCMQQPSTTHKIGGIVCGWPPPSNSGK